MSRTDNTRPYPLQCDDPWLLSFIEHNHRMTYAYYEFVPVTWKMVLRGSWSTSFDMLFAACMGRTRDGSRPTAEFSSAVDKLRTGAFENYFHTRVWPDPLEPLVNETILGTKAEVRTVSIDVPCDYEPRGSTRNYQMTRKAYASEPDMVRCVSFAIFHGGCKSKGGTSKRRRLRVERTNRRRLNTILHLARYDEELPALALPVARRRVRNDL